MNSFLKKVFTPLFLFHDHLKELIIPSGVGKVKWIAEAGS